MNGNCKMELISILDNVFQYSKPTILKLFVKFKFFDSLNSILKIDDVNFVFFVVKILFFFIDTKNSKIIDGLFELPIVLNHYESIGIIDRIESLSFNSNKQISRLASLFLDEYYQLVELKENISP